MNLENTYFVIAVVVLLVALAAVAFIYSRLARRSSEQSYIEIVGRLRTLDRDSVQRIALDAIEVSGFSRNEEADFPLDPFDISPLIGGLEGLEVLSHNCDVLIDLAFYVQKWHPEAIVVAEQLRLNAREINWHVSRLKGAALTGNLESAFPEYAQRAIAIYYLMTQRLLALYETTHLAEFADLQRAI